MEQINYDIEVLNKKVSGIFEIYDENIEDLSKLVEIKAKYPIQGLQINLENYITYSRGRSRCYKMRSMDRAACIEAYKSYTSNQLEALGAMQTEFRNIGIV